MKTAAIRTNFVINLLGPTARIAVAIVTTPIYVHHVGDARYGVISIVWVLLGYFGFLDLGLSRAATNALAKLRDAPQRERARVLLTTLVLNLGFGLVGGAILFILGAYLLEHVISLPDALRPEVARSFPWIAFLFPLALVSGVGIGAIESRERFLLANMLQIVGMSLSQIAPVVMAVVVGPSLTVVIPTAAVAQASSVILVLAVVYRLEGPFSLRAFDRKEARTLLSYGGWISVSNLISPILVSFDQFLIGSVMGVAAVAHYAVPMNLVSRSQIFPAALARTFFPRMSGQSAEAARALGARALSTLGYGFAAVCAPAIILAPAFFRYWIGEDFGLIAAPVARILFLGAWINGLAFVAFTLLQSQGRPDLTGKLHMAELPPFLAILWGLTTAFGVNGAAAAWTLRCSVDAFAMFWASGIPKRDVLVALRPVVLLAASELGSQFVGANLRAALLAAAVAGVVSLIFAYIHSEEWRLLIQAAAVRGRGSVDAIGRAVYPKHSTKPTVDP